MPDVIISIIPSIASSKSSYLVNEVLNALTGYYELLADTPVLNYLRLQEFISLELADVKDLTKVINRDYIGVICYSLNHNYLSFFNMGVILYINNLVTLSYIAPDRKSVV